MVWYLQLCMSLAHFFGKPYGFWVTGLVSGSQGANITRIEQKSYINAQETLTSRPLPP